MEKETDQGNEMVKIWCECDQFLSLKKSRNVLAREDASGGLWKWVWGISMKNCVQGFPECTRIGGWFGYQIGQKWCDRDEGQVIPGTDSAREERKFVSVESNQRFSESEWMTASDRMWAKCKEECRIKIIIRFGWDTCYQISAEYMFNNVIYC